MPEFAFNKLYFDISFEELETGILNVVAFEGHEAISRLFEYKIDLISGDPNIDAAKILNKSAMLTLNRGDEQAFSVHGIIARFEQYGQTPDYALYRALLVPRMWRLLLSKQNEVYQKKDIEQLTGLVFENSNLPGDSYAFELKETYPQMEYVIQHQENNFDFINRRLEHFGIFYFFDHTAGEDKIIMADNNDAFRDMEMDQDIGFNPNKDFLRDEETVLDISCREQVVTGLVRLKDYNYEYPDNQLTVESQIDTQAPGTLYEYGDNFPDENLGDMLARVRNEEVIAASKVFSGITDSRLFHAGFRFKMTGHFRDDWNDSMIVRNCVIRGNQRELFAYIPESLKVKTTFECRFQAIPADRPFRPQRITPKPRVFGVMSARLESAAGDEYAYLDDSGRYRALMNFDLNGDGEAKNSLPIRLSQPYSGPDYGIHFPNHAGTELLWTCVDGDPDRPVGLGTMPNPANQSPVTVNNKAQSVIRTAGQNELTFDDTTGSENIYIHGTKDQTIDIVNDRNKSVGNNQSESVGVDKNISVGGNHTEDVSGSFSQSVGASKTTSISAAYQITVGGVMNESVGAAKAEEIGEAKSVNIGGVSSESVGKSKSVDVADNISESAGKDISINAGKNYTLEAGENGEIRIGKATKIQSGEDFTLSGGKKGVLDIKDQLTIKCGKASIILKKNGDIQIKGNKINIKGSGDIKMKGSKIAGN